MMSYRQHCCVTTILVGLFLAGATLPAANAPVTAHIKAFKPRTPTAQNLRSRETLAPVEDIVNKEYAAQLQMVWDTVKDHFYSPDLNGVDWKRIGSAYRDRLALVRTKAEFEALMNRMLAELHASHTNYYTDDDMEFYMLPAVMRGDMRGHQVEQIGVLGRSVGQEYIVAATLDGSPAEAAGIVSGDHLLKADGQPFSTAGSFRGKAGSPVRIELRHEGETRTRTVTVVPVKQNLLRALLDATMKSARVLTIGGKRLGYIHLWAMANPTFRQALEENVLNKLYATDGLILDLRDGYGGTPWGYADIFFRPDISWGQQERGGKAASWHTGYGRPMVVLIDGGTRSSKEYLTYQFKVSHRAALVGTRTAEAFLGAETFPIGKDGLLELAVEDLHVDGKRLEGVGVAPDVEVAPALAYTPQDRQMARAEQVLLEAIRQRAIPVAAGVAARSGSSSP